MKALALLFPLLAVLAAPPATAQAVNGDWAHKQKLVVDTTSAGVELKEGAARVPLALRLHTGNFAFADARPDGADLRVTAADGKTPVPFHVEQFDTANELAVLWIHAQKLAPAARTDGFWLHWGNANAQAATDAKATYDAAQTLVLHFDEQGTVKDATGYAHQPAATALTPVAAGPLGAAAGFGGGSRIGVTASPNLKLTAANGFTFAAWIKPADLAGGTLFQQTEGGGGLSIRLSGNTLAVAAGGKGAREEKAQTPLQAGAWQHVAVSVGGNKVSFYINGAPAGTADLVITDNAGALVIGDGYRGEMDELTLASAPRGADYIKALHGSQQPDAPLLAFAEDEAEGGEASYFSILLGAVTLDGWVVIGILAVMGVVSFAVMIGKTRFLARVNKANDAFLELFRDKPAELLTPGNAETTAVQQRSDVLHSPIYRLYQIGLRELQHRFDAQGAAGQGWNLSGASLDAIRASMDAGLVRENQRLNSQIVLLTIAISGGPFLGLLGTVVGVMITFAAIAAAGDVNVNSIAPGIAAALVATVAGLAVAIPALFGYNWLAIQIKNVAADTQVFADEFLTKAAELHSR
jgi:biopolymer transport protein ExbB